MFGFFKKNKDEEQKQIELSTNINEKVAKIKYLGNGNPNENDVYNLFFKYKYRTTIEPASEEELEIFKKNCENFGVPNDVMEKLVAYYKMNNSFFRYFSCDEDEIFEWWEEENKELWLGQVDFWTFRYVEAINKFTIGDATNSSYGKDYEFDDILEMIESFISGKTI